LGEEISACLRLRYKRAEFGGSATERYGVPHRHDSDRVPRGETQIPRWATNLTFHRISIRRKLRKQADFAVGQ
jgi:hypothetical protein